MQIQTTSELATRMAQDPELVAKVKADPISAISNIAGAAYLNDVLIYRMVVGALGLVLLIAATGAIWITLSPTTKTIPDVLIALGSGAIGALAGLLAPSPAGK